MRKNKIVYKFILFFFLLNQFLFLPFLTQPFTLPYTNIKINPLIKTLDVEAATFASSSATLTNSRLSYKGGVASGGASSGATQVDIDTSGNPDNNTNHLFPKDVVCFPDQGENGCKGSVNYTVGTIIDSDTFSITSGLSTTLVGTDWVIASSSAQHQIVFTTVSSVNGGKLKVRIPAASSGYNNGIPDSTGFDANLLTNANINTYTSVACSGGCGATMGSATLSYASNNHIVTIPFTGTLPSGKTVSITIGSSSDANYQFNNPAPASGHTQGTADRYQIRIEETDGSDNVIDYSEVKVAVVEGVLVSATVEETIELIVGAGTADSGTICGVTRTGGSIDTTPYSVPFGSIITYDTFYDAYQTVEVRTNAVNGYSVTIEEDDQLNKDSDACDSPSNSGADETDGCIKDTTCDATNCDQVAKGTWKTATNNGFGFSLENVTGTDAMFLFNNTDAGCSTNSSPFFCAKQIADMQAGETKVQFMGRTSPTAVSKVNVCFRLSISTTQPFGYYTNRLKYIATASF